MKKSKKLIGIFSTIGALSIIAASCAIGIVYSKNNDVNASQSNIDNSSLSQASNPSSSSQVNTNSLSTTNAASTSNNSINNNSSSLTNSISSVNAKQLNNAPTLTLQNSMIDTSTLSNNPTLTYTCPNGNVLLFSVNNSNAQTVTLLGFSKKVSSDLVIPNILVTGGSFYAVTSISAGAFYGQGLSSVTFNNNLLSIGALAFANNNLTSLKFPHSLQSIGDKAFISNQFPHAYAVYLPINCSWNKNWLNCPFGCKNNLSKMTNGIQWVIQGQACYSYEALQFKWLITSYDVTGSTTSPSNLKTFTEYSQTEKPVTQHTIKAVARDITAQCYESIDGNLSEFCLFTRNRWGGIGWVFYFNPTNHTFNIWNGNNSRDLFGTSTSLTLSLYDPYSGQYIVNSTFAGMDTSVATASYPYQEGDILSFKINDSERGAWAYIASNFNQSMLTNTGFLDTHDFSDYLNQYIDINNIWTGKYGLPNDFAIKPNGIFPTLPATSLTNVSYNPTTGNLQLVGTSLPNLKFNVLVNNEVVGTFSTDQAGNINTANLDITKGLTSATNFTLQPVSSSTNNNSDVIYPAPFTSHLQGFNPKLGFIDLNVGDVGVQLLFNGITGKVCLGDIAHFWPAFATPFGTFSNLSTATSTFKSTGELNVQIVTSANVSQTYTYNFTENDNSATLNTFLTSLPYANGDTYYFSGTNAGVSYVWNNNEVVGYGYNKINKKETIAGFLINNTGITSVEHQYYEDSYLNNYNEGEDHGANSRVWNATYGWMQCNPLDWWANGYNCDNWFDPNQTMVEVANQIVQGYANPLNRMVAVFDWVCDNMDYTKQYMYGHTMREYFQHLQGVCCDFAAICGTMMKLAGFVSRQIIGGALGGYSPVSGIGAKIYGLNHQWLQVWMPSIQEWITIDPTWGMYGPIGTIQPQFNVGRRHFSITLVEWPEKGTGLYYDSYGTLAYHNYEYDNYFSYFKGCEYDALYNLGRHFGIVPGLKDDVYLYSYAQNIAKILNWAANPANSISSSNSYILGEMK